MTDREKEYRRELGRCAGQSVKTLSKAMDTSPVETESVLRSLLRQGKVSRRTRSNGVVVWMAGA